jgi:hypothetical protein
MRDLRAAPLQRLPDGTELRLGLSDGGDATGPWRMLYCLVEHGADATTQPATRGERGITGRLLGPVAFEATWREDPDRLKQLMNLLAWKTTYPVLYAGGVKLDRKGAATLRVSSHTGDPVAMRELSVAEPRPPIWTDFARRRGGNGFVVRDDALPMMPSLSRGGVAVSATQPAADAPLPGDLADTPAAASPLNLSLTDGAFVLRSERKFPNDADYTLLARWWVNDKPVAPREPFPSRLLVQQAMSQRMLGLVAELKIDFGLPDFLGELKADDRVALQLLLSPEGFEPATSRQQQQMLMQRMRLVDWPWPVLSNRIDFELTADLLAKHDNAPATQPSQRL